MIHIKCKLHLRKISSSYCNPLFFNTKILVLKELDIFLFFKLDLA